MARDGEWSWQTNPWKPVVELLWLDEDYKMVKDYLSKHPSDTRATKLLGDIAREMERVRDESM